MRIVKPFDWQFVRSTELDVVVEGVGDRSDLHCVLWRTEAFFTVLCRDRQILNRAPLLTITPGVAVARLRDLRAWSSCVIGIVGSEGDVELAASGVNLCHSDRTRWLSEGAQEPWREPPRHIDYPLRLLSSSESHYPAAAETESAKAENVQALLDKAPQGTSVRIAPLAAAEEVDALDVMIPEHSVSIDHPVGGKLQSASRFKTSPVYLARFKNAFALIPAGVVITEGQIWSDSSVAAFFNDVELRQYPQMFRANGHPGLLRNGVRTFLDICSDNMIDSGAALPMPICNVVYKNHGHWLINSLLSVYLLQVFVKERSIRLIVPEMNAYISESVASLGIPPADVLTAQPGLYYFDNVLFPSVISTHSNYFPPPAIRNMFKQIRDAVIPNAGRLGLERIYITRIGSGTQRKIGNELALIAALEERGFSCVAPHELSFKEEVACFAGASVVIGQLGAGLANIGFAPPGCTVIEICSTNYTSNDYWFISHFMNHRFIRLMIEADTDDLFTLNDFSFDVPLESTLASIDRILAKI